MTTLQNIARISVPKGANGWHVLADADVILFLDRPEHVAYSLLDGGTIWRKQTEGAKGGGLAIGWDGEVVIVQENRRWRPGDSRRPWTEGVLIATGEAVWRTEESPCFMTEGTTIEGYVYTPYIDPSGKISSARIAIGNGEWEDSDVVPWRAGPGGWYGIRKNRLWRFDGASSTEIASAAKLGLMGIAGRYAILAKGAADAKAIVVVDLSNGRRVTLLGEQDQFVHVCGEHLIVSEVGRTSEAIGVHADAVGHALEASERELPLAKLTRAWTTPGVYGISSAKLGRAFLATGLGLVDGTDGTVLVEDEKLDRAGGRFPRIVAWSTQVGDEHTALATVFGPATPSSST
jgi:hypothetical protein